MPPSGISYGDAKSVLKGEDNHVVLSAGASCFAVFDGHGGTKACKHGVDALAPAILALGVNATTNAIEDAFWEADAGLGGQTTDGSTATILLCDDDGAGAQADAEVSAERHTPLIKSSGATSCLVSARRSQAAPPP